VSPRPKNAAIVSRAYRPTPGACESALQILLKPPAKKEGGPTTAPKNAERSSDGIGVKNHSTR
jgi:hypothetical protein